METLLFVFLDIILETRGREMLLPLFDVHCLGVNQLVNSVYSPRALIDS